MSGFSNILKGNIEYESIKYAISSGRVPMGIIGLTPVHKAHYISSLCVDTDRKCLIICPDEGFRLFCVVAVQNGVAAEGHTGFGKSAEGIGAVAAGQIPPARAGAYEEAPGEGRKGLSQSREKVVLRVQDGPGRSIDEGAAGDEKGHDVTPFTRDCHRCAHWFAMTALYQILVPGKYSSTKSTASTLKDLPFRCSREPASVVKVKVSL